MPFLQDIIYSIEVGAGRRTVRWVFMGLLLLGLFLGYNLRAYKNLASEDAMDAAQVGRNLAEGRGFSTLFVRPLSLHLLRQNGGLPDDPAQLKGPHPDLANAPVYPLVLATLMKVLPFDYQVRPAAVFWGNDGHFWRYQPDFLIALFNQALFLAVIVLTFLLARWLFDPTIAWVSALILAGTELFWRFSVSGLSTNLLLLLFLLLVWCMALLEVAVREGRWGQRGLLALTAAAGLLTGLGGMTRYSFGWMILPVLGFLVLFGGRQRVILTLLCAVVFAGVMTPWIVRNEAVCGLPFGTATYAVVESTPAFPGQKLERSLNPDFENIGPAMLWRKLFGNAREIVVNELPNIGGSWVTAYFLAGLLVAFRSPTISRLRYFMLASLFLLIVVQALGRTHLTEDTPEINSENLIILLFPLVLIYGVCLFFLLLEQVRLPDPRLRLPLVVAFGVLSCAPMVFAFLPPRTIPVAYPPYLPPIIQSTCNWMKPDELMMSDIPWAVAWYGHRQCVSLTLNAQTDFFAVNDDLKPVKGLYLTPATMDARFLSEWIRAGEFSWGSFILESIVKKEIPPAFPLRQMPAGYLPEQIFLTDWPRWKKVQP
jgi:Dolichyl-phosphate-mannose-protein mannosyltransferase